MNGPQTFLDDIAQIKSLMITVATGKARIDDVEAEYVDRRSVLAARLANAGIQDPNRFRSLWDWYNHWKAEGMTSYQQRRTFVNQIYAPVIDILEQEPRRLTDSQGAFSERYGFAPATVPAAITVREGAPDELRNVIARRGCQPRAGL